MWNGTLRCNPPPALSSSFEVDFWVAKYTPVHPSTLWIIVVAFATGGSGVLFILVIVVVIVRISLLFMNMLVVLALFMNIIFILFCQYIFYKDGQIANRS